LLQSQPEGFAMKPLKTSQCLRSKFSWMVSQPFYSNIIVRRYTIALVWSCWQFIADKVSGLRGYRHRDRWLKTGLSLCKSSILFHLQTINPLANMLELPKNLSWTGNNHV
jgi:hypothetical protein